MVDTTPTSTFVDVEFFTISFHSVMKNLTIVSGKFSTGENSKGHFTGKAELGQRVLIYKDALADLGITAKKPFDFAKGSLFVIADTMTYEREEDGSSYSVLEALRVFTDRDTIKQAHVNANTLNVEIQSELKSAANAAGLTQNELALLLANA